MVRALALLALLLSPSLAFAHVGLGDAHGLSHGFLHPLTGIDHMLAMVGVGLFAAHLGGRAIWLVPASFLTMMAVGGALGMAGVPVPLVETGIGLSIVALGLIIASEIVMPVYPAMAVVGCFALFHGHAHGAEMPRSASGVAYAVGFLAATGLLHLLGVGLGIALQAFAQRRVPLWSKMIGTAMALAGVGLLAGAF